jgi:hypothetical protein
VKKPPSPAATKGTSGSPRAETPKKNLNPSSPQSYKMGMADRVPTGGDLAQPRVGKMPKSPLRVADSQAKDPDFIKARFHIGRFLMAVMNTEAE